MERTYGSKYALGQDKSRAEIAQLIRADIKAAITAGQLPAKLKVSVKTRNYSGGGSIDVRVTAGLTACDVYSPAGMRAEASDDFRLSNYQRFADRWMQVVDVLKAIHSAYNHDGSDVMTDYFDVRYYGDVGIDWQFDKALRAEAVAIHNTRAAKPRVRFQFAQACAA